MRDVFDSQLRELLEEVIRMGGLAESMIGLAVGGLVGRDATAAGRVDEQEGAVNALQVEIDDRVVRMMIQQQPVARDARFLVTASRVASGVERIADQAVNISQNTAYLLQYPPGPPLPELDDMARAARQMVADAMAALVTRDVALAEKVLDDEKAVDALRDRIFRALLGQIITDPLTAQRSLSLILISRNLEKIGDEATNVAEEVVYMVRGQDVRHAFDRPVRAHADEPFKSTHPA